MSIGGSGRNTIRRALVREDLRNVYRVGSRYQTSVATVHVLPDPHRGFRLAVPVGKRIGPAVVRNRVRRRIREAFRAVERRLRPGGDIIIVARLAARTASFETLVEELRKSFYDAGLYSANG